ncbi:hypothetical protein, partial [Liquorilactobacillus nagelii]|uniref:hypothetical protein n=1 Tax=Liquorilactobacillus nagelii TaxID=82688 RepID=UPI00311F60DC
LVTTLKMGLRMFSNVWYVQTLFGKLSYFFEKLSYFFEKLSYFFRKLSHCSYTTAICVALEL